MRPVPTDRVDVVGRRDRAGGLGRGLAGHGGGEAGGQRGRDRGAERGALQLVALDHLIWLPPERA